MSSYLQRLLDRAAPVAPLAPSALPAGLSQSPISLSDQRLADPEFAGQFSPESADEAGPTADLPAAARPQDAASVAPAPKSVEQPKPFARSITPDPTPRAAEKPFTPEPVVDGARIEVQHPQPVGQISADDLVLPDPKDEAADIISATSPQPSAPAEPPAPRIEQSGPVLVDPAPTNIPDAADQLVQTDINTPSEAHPPRPAPIAAPEIPAPALTTPPIEAKAPASAVETGPVEIMPPPVVVPALPDTPPVEVRQPDRSPTAAAQRPKQDETAQPPTAPTPPRQNRPTTARAASIIGPLTPRRQALTLFGLRRR